MPTHAENPVLPFLATIEIEIDRIDLVTQSLYLPPHRSSATILVPGDLGDGRVDRHRQGADDHPKSHLPLAIG